jgi:hypothetical protein
MKKIAVFFFGMVLVMSLCAQTKVQVANATKNLMVVNGVNIAARASKEVSLPVENEEATFSVTYYEGLEKIGPVSITRPVSKGRIIMRDFSPAETASASRRTVKSGEGAPAQQTASAPDPNYSNSTDWWSYVDVTPQNKLKGYSIFVPSAPFRGLALKSGQTSEKSARLQTGNIMFPVFLASENDSVGNLGIRFSWALVNKILTEGQKVLDFTAEDIMKVNSGDIIKKTLVSKLTFDFIIAEGKTRGTVIPAGYPEKIELYVGWNIIPIQYKDSQGLPTQAILILLVNDLRKPLMARGKTNTDEISIQPNNIVITNFGR